MLNRRILRVKAMQALYSFYQTKSAGLNVALESIAATFSPDPNAMEPRDPKELALYRNIATKLLHKLVYAPRIAFDGDTPEEVKKEVTAEINNFHNTVRKDELHFKKLMVREVEKILERFLKVLILPGAFAKLNAAEQHKNTTRHVKSHELIGEYNLANNKVLADLLNAPPIHQQVVKHNVSWTNEEQDVKNWYKNILKEDEVYKAYLEKDKPTIQDDIDILNHIYRQIVFKHEEIALFFELWDISWSEDKDILKGMVKKTLKSYQPDQEPKFELLELALNWEEDKEYFEQLYQFTVQNERAYEKIIAEKSKNWDIERISLTDKIILEMALAEMVNFPSIPVKVSINEYIELSKNYSTPKSKQFVNGVLDVLAVELKDKGIIKKSGRGLIDNQ